MCVVIVDRIYGCREQGARKVEIDKVNNNCWSVGFHGNLIQPCLETLLGSVR